MTRKLIDYKKLDHTLRALLIESYSHGYGGGILTFKNTNGDIIEALEIRTVDTPYMVKISRNLSKFISNFEDIINKELEVKSNSILKKVDASEVDPDLKIEEDSEWSD